MSSDDINSPTREALDRVGGAAKKVLGTVTGNADLLEEGQLQSVAADGRRVARELADEAELKNRGEGLIAAATHSAPGSPQPDLIAEEAR